MARHAVGSVPYVNAAPLIGKFVLEGSQSPVEVLADVPSRLPALLDSGRVDAILVSSIESLRRKGAQAADGVAIISRGRVDSVRLFSRKPFGEIQRLALDASSMTSNLLAQILLRELHGSRPETRVMPPVLADMLDECDAGVLIGDIGMQADGTGLNVMDLGEAWTGMTGLPFVWAMWVGRISPELAGLLAEAWQWSGLGADGEGGIQTGVLEMAQGTSGWPREKVDRYLIETMSFGLDDVAWQGLVQFMERLEKHGLAEGLALPQRVGPQ